MMLNDDGVRNGVRIHTCLSTHRAETLHTSIFRYDMIFCERETLVQVHWQREECSRNNPLIA